jgi:hypothetical protein
MPKDQVVDGFYEGLVKHWLIIPDKDYSSSFVKVFWFDTLWEIRLSMEVWVRWYPAAGVSQ